MGVVSDDLGDVGGAGEGPAVSTATCLLRKQLK